MIEYITININETVSLGDTAISLHILQLPLKRVGAMFWKVKTQSAKICLNFHCRDGVEGGGGLTGIEWMVLQTNIPEIIEWGH